MPILDRESRVLAIQYVRRCERYYRQTAVWTISRFLCRSFTAYSNFVHTFGIKRQYTVLVSEGEPQIPH